MKVVTEKVDQALHDTQSDAYDIMNALQVQDITTQQIEGAHALLRSVQGALERAVGKIFRGDSTAGVAGDSRLRHACQLQQSEERQRTADEAMLVTGDSEESGFAPGMPESSSFEDLKQDAVLEEIQDEPTKEEIEDLLSWGSDDQAASGVPGEEDEAMLTLEEDLDPGNTGDSDSGEQALGAGKHGYRFHP